MSNMTLSHKQIFTFSDNFCGMLANMYTHTQTKKGNKHTGKDESDHFLYIWEVNLDVVSSMKILPGRIGRKI